MSYYFIIIWLACKIIRVLFVSIYMQHPIMFRPISEVLDANNKESKSLPKWLASPVNNPKTEVLAQISFLRPFSKRFPKVMYASIPNVDVTLEQNPKIAQFPNLSLTFYNYQSYCFIRPISFRVSNQNTKSNSNSCFKSLIQTQTSMW